MTNVTFNEDIKNQVLDLPVIVRGQRENEDSRPDWDSWFMGMCCVAATRSLDTSTAHGAIICDSDHRPKGTGYNGFPRNCDDSVFPSTRPLKYDITIHAEENCLLNSENLLVGSNYTIYVTGLPCSRCFIKIMQYDIKRVVYGNVTSRCVDENQSKLVFELASMRKIQLDKFDRFDCQKNINVFKGMLSFSPNLIGTGEENAPEKQQ